MTKEDEALIAHARQCSWDGYFDALSVDDVRALLRLLDEQAARVAALTKALEWMRFEHRCCAGYVDAAFAAIRARAEPPIGTAVEGVFDRRANLMQRLAAATDEPAPVAPGLCGAASPQGGSPCTLAHGHAGLHAEGQYGWPVAPGEVKP